MHRVLLIAVLCASALSGGTVDSLSASPGTITFNATEPDNGSVAGSSVATVVITTSSASGKAWALSVQSTTADVPGCTGVQVSDVTVTCNLIVDTTLGSNSCAAPQSLSTSYATIASGVQSIVPITAITVTLTFTFADSWHHPAKGTGCPLTIQYQAYSAP